MVATSSLSDGENLLERSLGWRFGKSVYMISAMELLGRVVMLEDIPAFCKAPERSSGWRVAQELMAVKNNKLWNTTL